MPPLLMRLCHLSTCCIHWVRSITLFVVDSIVSSADDWEAAVVSPATVAIADDSESNDLLWFDDLKKQPTGGLSRDECLYHVSPSSKLLRLKFITMLFTKIFINLLNYGHFLFVHTQTWNDSSSLEQVQVIANLPENYSISKMSNP